MIIAKNISTNFTTDEFRWGGGVAYIFIQGTFDGCDVSIHAGQDKLPKLQLDLPDGSSEWTEPSYTRIHLPSTGQFEFVISNVGGSTDITISIQSPAMKN